MPAPIRATTKKAPPFLRNFQQRMAALKQSSNQQTGTTAATGTVVTNTSNIWTEAAPYLHNTRDRDNFKKWIDSMRKPWVMNVQVDIWRYASPESIRPIEMYICGSKTHRTHKDLAWQSLQWDKIEAVLVELFLSGSAVKESLQTSMANINLSGFNRTAHSMQKIIASITSLLAQEGIDMPYTSAKFGNGEEKTLITKFVAKLKDDRNTKCNGIVSMMEKNGSIPTTMQA